MYTVGTGGFGVEGTVTATEKLQFRVLVVDDDPVCQAVAMGLLESLGHEADGASDGEEAITQVEGNDYDLILMDMQMPDASGLEITQRVRALGPRGTTPRIFSMTATAISDDLDLCRDAGMNGHVSKPITRDKLTDVLAKLAGRG
jgi:two-component system, sensor histidine kinase and response regulator